jgi:hypothetical protein
MSPCAVIRSSVESHRPFDLIMLALWQPSPSGRYMTGRNAGR